MHREISLNGEKMHAVNTTEGPGFYGYLRYQASTYVNCLHVKVQKKLAPEDT